MMRRAPLLPIALALMAGIAAQHWLTAMPTALWWVLTGIAAVATGIMLTIRRRLDSYWPIAALIVCMVTIGATIGRRHDPRYNPNDWRCHVAAEERPEFIELRLTTTPVPRERSYMAKAEVESIGGEKTEGETRVYFKHEEASGKLRYGDRLLAHCYIGGERKTIYITSDHYIITKRDSTSLRARSEGVRMRLLKRMQDGPLERQQAGIAEALTLGWRADLDKETQQSFRDAGLAHLLAVSGLHVGLVAGMLGMLCFFVPKTKRGRIVRGVVQLIGVWTFTMLSGMAPSTMRAALMFSLFIISNILARRTPKMNLLACTAIITLGMRPMLLFDVGWQLSYSAVAGILIARPVIMQYNNKLWQAATVSIIATLATLPVTLAVFHRMQPYFLIANVVIVPLAGVILALAVAYMAVPCAVTAWPLGIALKSAEWLTETVAGLPGAVVEVAEIGTWGVIAIAVTVVGLLVTANRLNTAR